VARRRRPGPRLSRHGAARGNEPRGNHEGGLAGAHRADLRHDVLVHRLHLCQTESDRIEPGGTAVTILGTTLGEWRAWDLTPRGLGAIAYLVVFGSILGYSAYAYALRHASATIVGTYAYVNPVIAVLLGWLLLQEPVTGRTFLSMVMIFSAVVWIHFSHKAGRAGQPEHGTAVRPSGRQAVDPSPEATT
jgi:hypothetical protein